MKSNPVRILTLLIAALVFGLSMSGLQASDAARTKALYHKLQALPPASTPAPHISKIVIALIKLNPLRAAKYFRTGINLMEESNTGEKIHLAKEVNKIVNRSNLSERQKKSVTRQIIQSIETGPY